MTTPFGPETGRHRRLPKSHRVGPALLPDGTHTTAYRAVGDVRCGACARLIPPGHLFSRGVQQRQRRGTFGVGLAKVPLCVACRPVQVEEDTDAPAPTDGGQGAL